MTPEMKAAVNAGGKLIEDAPDPLLLADRLARLRAGAVGQLAEIDATLDALAPFLPERFDALRVDTWHRRARRDTRWIGPDGFRAWVHAHDTEPALVPAFATEKTL
jgi:hypothetical protein